MSLQIATGYGSLFALGLGAGDVATLYSLGRRAGNWLTASQGDKDFLEILQEDEYSILKRRGLIDLDRFKRRWGESLRLLENGRPQRFKNKAAKSLLNDLSIFSAAMMCLVAALDEFASAAVVKDIIKRFLIKLLGYAQEGDDLLVSQLPIRVKAWRSAAAVREINIECRRIHNELLAAQYILGGYMIADESPDVADFLYWLFAGDTEEFITPSSDVAGIAVCLAQLSFEVFDVDGLGSVPRGAPCGLVYKCDYGSGTTLYGKHGKGNFNHAKFRSREVSTAVSLSQQEETFSVFPIMPQTANRCREAWEAGQKAARFVKVQLSDECFRVNSTVAYDADLRYDFVNVGTEIGRVETGIWDMVSTMGLVMNREVCDALSHTLRQEDKGTLRWVLDQTAEQIGPTLDINCLDLDDEAQINAFTVFQAFFMGYYYTVFLSILDTSSLQVGTVSGAWGYRSAAFLQRMRGVLARDSARHDAFINNNDKDSSGLTRFSRQKLLHVLSMLFCNYTVDIPTLGRSELCLGIVGKASVLASSLLRTCSTPTEIGKFVLLDVDVGGIPTDASGLVRGGEMQMLRHKKTKPLVQSSTGRSESEDFTQHLEPDWAANPDRVVLCIRFKGRRIGSINPATVDPYFCRAFTEPIKDPNNAPIGPVVECDVQDFLDGDLPHRSSTDKSGVVLVKSCGKPCMRYAAVAWYDPMMTVLSSNCIHAAATRRDFTLIAIVIA